MQYLAIDLGGKRTGLAVGSDRTKIASPLEAFQATNDEYRLQQLARYIRDYQPDALVLGLPLNMDGTQGPSAKKAHAFAALLIERFKLAVHLVDERLSSANADDQMSQSGLTHRQKKSRRDALAAATILQDFFDQSPT